MRNNDLQSSEDYNYLFKSTSPCLSIPNTSLVVLVGDANVGKTHLLNRQNSHYFSSDNVIDMSVEVFLEPIHLLSVSSLLQRQ